jgi:hypothetical protein
VGGSEAAVDPQVGGGRRREAEGTSGGEVVGGGEVAGEAGWPAGMMGAAAACRERGN